MILAYHEIVPDDASYSYSVTCDDFAHHLALVNEQRGTTQTQVTLDDGHISQYTHGLPLLERFGVKGVFYVTAGWTGTQPEYMNVSQLREIVSLGHAVQAHGWSHKMMTHCSPSELYEELHRSKDVLEDRLGVAIRALSIPHGRWNDQVLEACASAGYQEVYISDPRVGPVDRLGVRLVGRLMVTRGMSARLLSSFLKADRQIPARARIKDTVKRAVRAVVGERLYHELWRFAAADSQRSIALAPANRATRILQLISSEGYYGAESMLVNLATSLDAAGCRNVVGVFCNGQNPHIEVAERARQNGLRVEVIPCSGRVDREAIRTIRKTIYQHGIDVVHTHGFKANLYGALAAGPAGVPLMATYHLDWPDRGFALYCYHLLDRLILHRFQKVMPVSDAIARSLRRWGLGRKKVETVANGIDMTPFLSLPPGTGPAASSKPTVIGLVGRLTPQKGHRYLLQAAPGILERFPKVEFHFVGDGYERAALLDVAVALGIGDRVKFTGSRSDMPAVYASIDILVLPSINEGMPMTLIEGLAACRPVVASNVGDVPKLIRHGETGLLVEPADAKGLQTALIQLLSDPALRDAVATKGRRWVEQNFSATAMARRYRELYEETLRYVPA
jgi:glycosyltransferase involved in cell wall biosynthesis